MSSPSGTGKADRAPTDIARLDEAARPVPFRDAFWTWVRIAALSFGGPAGQIAVMHRILVEEKRWISERRVFHPLQQCNLLPGAQGPQAGVSLPWVRHRHPRRGIAAGPMH